MDFSEDDLHSLGAKLAALELTEGEHAALTALIAAADDEADVEGFAMGAPIDRLSFAPVRVKLGPYRPPIVTWEEMETI